MNLTPILKTERLTLRMFQESDLPFLLSHFSDVAVCEYLMDNERIKTMDEAKEILTWSYGDKKCPTNNRWMIIEDQTNLPIGTIGFHRWDKQNKIAEIGYDLSPTKWSKGYMSEAIKETLVFLFDRLDVDKVQAIVHVDNAPSKRLLEKTGFRIEGNIRNIYFLKGEYHDHYLMTIQKSDYKE
ncbi:MULTISPECIES: GNAT family N-acetyltransferase [unclassified Fusibacter]|uniref:GNAT family N-acetyltransferase n=1 Tax=unclassified Fusibacter TaxID=2624464 RepID=UPI001012252A|nr:MULTISPECIES: GNAT family protein [unclassified Fusibacter]MCK8058393.1 GNAT family N-acetyltransferase [Fusibacter sp. A2]NPE20976.1 GNAT family N-acetyltransferase [Fusibacter sp. A1]RXV63176.1 N-acetyltransferase [Fusibacter sp. A1]